MPQKKSHRVASRQAAVGKERKRKKRSQASPQKSVPAPVKPASPATTPAEPMTARPAQSTKEPRTSHQYIRGELRKIAIIAGCIVVVLIILAFVL